VSRARIAVAALSLSAAAFVGLTVSEGWEPVATIPVAGDRPTNGFGGTVNEDGSAVKLGERIAPVPALKRSLAHIQKDEAGLKRCVTAPLHQAEYDLLVDHAYNYGVRATCTSSIVREANEGNYAASCEAYLKFRFVAGYDCSTPGNTRCRGVWLRSKARRDACMAVQ
jgi:GH24 family phage-related lysozyme (muramidase)